MSVDVAIPVGLWEDEQEGVIGTWYYADGETVKKGQVLAEILTEKVAHDIESPIDGKLKILVAEEGTVTFGQAIAQIIPSA